MAVSVKTRCIIWARAAGRCQFPGCNDALIGDLAAGHDTVNKAYIAHIVAEKPKGPRGDEVLSPLLADDPENLLLLCDVHHRLIDREGLPDYPRGRLLNIKRDCEARIEAAVSVGLDKSSKVLRYAANIGKNESVISFIKCREAMSPDYFPLNKTPIDLSLGNLELNDSEAGYFEFQVANLRSLFNSKIKGVLESQSANHLSVFALAPIPLLMELGRLLSDISPAEVYQLHREPAGWNWAESGDRLILRSEAPEVLDGPIALKLELSSNISDERVKSVLGHGASVWSVSAETPHNDAMRYREDLGRFRSTIREIFARIKDTHGENKPINIFPSIPVSAAVEFGRVWMPKADLPLKIYDQSRRDNGFVQRLEFGGNGQ